MSSVTEDNPPNLSMYSENEEHVDNNDGAIVAAPPNDKLIELELARLRVKELELRLRMQQPSQDSKCRLDEASTEAGDDAKTEPILTNRIASALERRLDLPKRDLQHFDGNPKNYCAFMKAFGSMIESQITDDEARLGYLIQYCDGEAKSQIQHCTVLQAADGYRLAKEILHKRFGQNYMIARAFIDDLLNGPSIEERDSKSLVELAQQLMVCDVTLKQIDYAADLNSRATIQAIVRRLPSRLRFKWAKAVNGIRQFNREPEIADLARFIESRVDGLCSDYGELALSMAAEDRKRKKCGGRSDLAALRKNVHSSQMTSSKQTSSQICSVCNGPHYPDQCPKLLEMSVDERLETVRRRKLCRICLKANHMAKGCKLRRFCSVEGCGGDHNRLLHSVKKSVNRAEIADPHNISQSQANHSTAPSTGSNNVALAVLPVTLRNNKQIVKTFAFLDNCSDSTFISKSVADALQLRGEESVLQLRTLAKETALKSMKVSLDVEPQSGGKGVHVPRAWVVAKLPALSRVIPSKRQLQQWSHLQDIEFTNDSGSEIGILLGTDVPKAHWVVEQRIGRANEPYAVRTLLGWTLLGPVSTSLNKHPTVNHSTFGDIDKELERFYQQDIFEPTISKDKEMSVNDRRALNLMQSSITLRGGHYEIALPWLRDPTSLPNNKPLAMRRLGQLRKRLIQDENLRTHYWKVMNDYIEQGHAELAQEGDSGSRWYLPHHPVFHPKKPDKLRIVFDCAAVFNGCSLNSALMSGPDLNNSLFGVLLRFRREKVAVIADIKAMFHQVRVPDRDRDALRFLWWSNIDLNGPPVEYRMCVHLFGATSSPSCSSFALNRTIDDNKDSYDADVVALAKRCFYVDDCLFSASETQDAFRIAQQMKDLLACGGFDLTKWVSNDRRVLELLSESDPSVEIVQLALQESANHRTLGLNWNVKKDVYFFHLEPMSSQPTRRSILSYVSGFYDPLGYAAPITLVAKILLQQLCKLKLDWDKPIEGTELQTWTKWSSTVLHMEDFLIPRCFKQRGFENPVEYQLHIFSDASEVGYGAVAYLLLKNSEGRKTCQLVMARARVAPIRPITIPRLELAAAVLAVKLAKQVQSEIDIDIPPESTSYWTDSLIVLHSIRNTSKRFPTFFANRLSTIHESSEVAEWRYVETKNNPADIISRGAFANETKKLDRWIKGPLCLLKDKYQPILPLFDLDETFPSAFAVTQTETKQHNPLMYFNGVKSWFKLLRYIAWFLRYKEFLKTGKSLKGPLTLSEIRQSTKQVIKLVQLESFPRELKALKNVSHSTSSDPINFKTILRNIPSTLQKLNPVLIDDVLRVGGRLQHAPLPLESRYPIILPSKHFVTRLLIEHYHVMNGHMGLSYLMSCVRQRYWILKSNKTINSVLRSCFKCRRWFGQPCQQVLAPLPADRLISHENPFTICGVDYFGPMYVKRGRIVEKRYGCLFTCFSSRAIHIEVAHTLDTDSFLCAFNRFVARRGCPQRLYSDNGSNFKGAESIIKTLLRAWNQEKITNALLLRECDWIFNPPKASHRGGVWERIIRSIKRALMVILEEQPMTDEVLHTTLLEIERILNDRPLVKQTDDPDDQYSLTPSKLILLRSNESVPISDELSNERFGRRWRQAQYLADLFWRHWIRRYLPTLQLSSQWFSTHPNLVPGDLLLIQDENIPRGRWPKGVVEEVVEGTDGRVRQVLLRTANGMVRRDIRQLCRLEGNLATSFDDGVE